MVYIVQLENEAYLYLKASNWEFAIYVEICRSAPACSVMPL